MFGIRRCEFITLRLASNSAMMLAVIFAEARPARACSCRIESQNSQGPVNGRVLAALIRLGAEPCRRHILRTFACGLSHASKAGLRDVRQPSSSTSAQVRQSNG